MRDRPGGARLLELARAALVDQLLPALPAGERYAARLVAKAMAIAARELSVAEAPVAAERARLARLFGEDRDGSPASLAAEATEEALERLTWRLTAEIRAGHRDGDKATHELLCQGVRGRLRLTNPGQAGDG